MLHKYSADHVWIDGRRYYKVNGDIYPGVTTILSNTKTAEDKASLDQWRQSVGAEEAERIMQASCERGTIIHGLIEGRLEGKDRECPAPVKGFWNSVRPLLDCVSDVQLIEGAVWHSSGFAGSVDCVGLWNGEPCIIDWKTSGKVKKREWIGDYFQQVSAYRAAVNELYGLSINAGVVVIALEDRPAQVFRIADEEMDWHWRCFGLRVKEFGFSDW